MIQPITRALRRLLPFDRATLTLYDPGGDVLRVFALEGPFLPQHFGGIGTAVSRQGSHVGWVLDHQTPLLRRDLEHQFPVEKTLLAEGIRSYIVVPLITKGRAFGTLNVGSRTLNQYGEEDAAFMFEVAKQVALAVENMLAYEEIAELKARLEQESLYLQEEIKTQHNFEEIIGQSPAMKKVLQAVETVAPTNASVLILGETGTGKELIARALHHLSPRKTKPLVKVNCAALPAGLIESELFGHEKGAFTGALSRRIGRFELAHGGTIFLDEIGELPRDLQVKLLRVLQEGEFEWVGGAHTFKADVRVIAATNRDLAKAMQEGTFRQDLFYRLYVFPIPMPPLRERRADIPLLVKYFAIKYGKSFGKRIETIPQQTMANLQAYLWPGNVRELEHVIERAVIISQGSRLELGDWLPQPVATPRDLRLSTLAELERDHIIQVLELTGWRVSGEHGAAKVLGLKPTTLEARMKKSGIQRPK
jgi:formate hydrogenlyase transcriptional activator